MLTVQFRASFEASLWGEERVTFLISARLMPHWARGGMNTYIHMYTCNLSWELWAREHMYAHSHAYQDTLNHALPATTVLAQIYIIRRSKCSSSFFHSFIHSLDI